MSSRSAAPAPCPCAPEPAGAARASGAATVALLGMPNTGKSTLFNRLTGGRARVANWPGLTVDLLRGDLPTGPGSSPWQLVDLPGIHGLSGDSEDEAIVLRFLAASPPDLVVVVLNATQVDSQLRLLLQVRALGFPTLLALNMSDEARRFGVEIDTARLSERLGLPVLALSAREGEGIEELLGTIPTAARSPARSPCGEGLLPLGPEGIEELQERLVAECVRLPDGLQEGLTRRIDAVLLHPLVGPLVFLAIALAMFQAIYAVALPLQEGLAFLFDAFRGSVLLPQLTALGAPSLLISFLVDGLWMGITTVAGFLPLIFCFYLMLAVVEDSGYLPRAAFLMDGLMRLLGLDGRTFVLQVMGLGCNVPAILGTRVIRDPGMRLLAMLVIPFSLCQARLTVFVFLAGIFFPHPWWAPGLVVFGYYVLSFVAAILTGLIFQRAFPGREAFVLEFPPYRPPSPSVMLHRAWREMANFMVTTRSFIVAGAALVWCLTNLPPGSGAGITPSFAHWIGAGVQPVLAPIGMTPDLTVSLFFGFIAKEILLGAMAVIHHTSEAGLGPALRSALSPLQALSFMTFTLLYTPCLSTVAAQLKESRNRGFVALSVLWSLALAWGMAFTVYQGGMILLRAFPPV